MHYYLSAFKKYSDFNGRATRSEYWYFYLFNIIFLIAAMILDSLMGLKFSGQTFGVIYVIYGLACLLPGIAVTFRRLHDVGKSGWMLFIALIPIIGAIWLLVLYVRDSEPLDNKYGPNPKGALAQNPIVPIKQPVEQVPVSAPEVPPQA